MNSSNMKMCTDIIMVPFRKRLKMPWLNKKWVFFDVDVNGAMAIKRKFFCPKHAQSLFYPPLWMI
ncbi:MAG: hypothetical protein Ct9H300mP29_9070 [Candidatus Neomarinimicrobiota bacterium]|nr:MAG: hypothetical protein Ct9H300mP29_9070 [Candidatus Neomarinimicrobiota bacterium]